MSSHPPPYRGGEGSNLGYAVSLSANGMTVAIKTGVLLSLDDEELSDTVVIYRYNGSGWQQLGDVLESDEEVDSINIGSVSLSADGETVAIGTQWGNDDGSGYVRIYQYVNLSWVQLEADINGEARIDNSGGSVSLSADGSTVAIGAIGNDGNGTDSGHVRVYELTQEP